MTARLIEQKTLRDNASQYVQVGDMFVYDGHVEYDERDHWAWKGEVPDLVVTSPFEVARDRFADKATARGADVFTVLSVTEYYFTGYAYKRKEV